MAPEGNIHVLIEDPELADGLAPEARAQASRECLARTFTHSVGPWSPPPEAEESRHFGVGLLMIEGLVVRHVGVAGRYGAELLGEGDLLCPWQWELGMPSLPRTSHGRVLRPCRLAILDIDFVRCVGRYPEIVSNLFNRALQRARHVGVNMAIVQQPRIDIRLHMLFWELADRWGVVRQDGVHVPIALTHATLADLVAARRPTVTKALGELAERSAVIWTGEAWLLPGEPPAELAEVGSVSVAEQPAEGAASVSVAETPAEKAAGGD